MNRQEFCVQIVDCLENLWSENVLVDYAVKVQGETIRCHRLILAACSEFFKACFRSGMIDATENCVVLHEVSSEVFRFILNYIYTGTSVLTLDNFIDVWRAAHMLQVNFLVHACEDFAIGANSLDTWENIYVTAKLLDSERVLGHLHPFMLKNFEQISLSTSFLQMSFDEVQDLIKSQDLVVQKEDLVLESVLKWVKYEPKSQINLCEYLNNNHDFTVSNNDLKTDIALLSEDKNECEETVDNRNLDTSKVGEPFKTDRREINDVQSYQSHDSVEIWNSSRKDKLTELLKQVRTCLVSPDVLSSVLRMKLVSENEDSRKIISEALSYHVQDFRHGQWLSAAIHRSCSEYIQAGAFVLSDDYFVFVSASTERPFTCRPDRCKGLQDSIQLVNFNGELYATGKQLDEPNEPCRMFVSRDNSWKEVMEMPSHNLLLVSHGDFIYIVNRDDACIYNLNPKERVPSLEKLTHFPENVNVTYASIVQDFLLLFCSETQNGSVETAVHQFDISSKVWTRLVNLAGPAEHVISFRDDKHNYVLQANGSMWLVTHTYNDGNFEFKFLAKFWDVELKLYGALTYNKKLIILTNITNLDATKTKTIPNHFTKISYWTISKTNSNFIPITVLKPPHVN